MADSSAGDLAESDAASIKVFETYELLENILLHLPLQDLLLSQAVCKQWSAVINNSVQIQRALFKKPVNKKAVHSEVIDESEGVEEYHTIWRDADGQVQQEPTFNPFLIRFLELRGSEPCVVPLTLSRNGKRSWNRDCASWRDMQFSQPAMDTLTFWCNDEELVGPKDHKGVTLASMGDFVGKHAQACDECGILSASMTLVCWMYPLLKTCEVSGWEVLKTFKA